MVFILKNENTYMHINTSTKSRNAKVLQMIRMALMNMANTKWNTRRRVNISTVNLTKCSKHRAVIIYGIKLI